MVVLPMPLTLPCVQKLAMPRNRYGGGDTFPATIDEKLEARGVPCSLYAAQSTCNSQPRGPLWITPTLATDGHASLASSYATTPQGDKGARKPCRRTGRTTFCNRPQVRASAAISRKMHRLDHHLAATQPYLPHITLNPRKDDDALDRSAA